MTIQCLKCQHNLQLSECGGCVSNGLAYLKNQYSINENKYDIPPDNPDLYKYSCRIVINDPKELQNVNPLKCKFYLSKAFQLQ